MAAATIGAVATGLALALGRAEAAEQPSPAQAPAPPKDAGPDLQAYRAVLDGLTAATPGASAAAEAIRAAYEVDPARTRATIDRFRAEASRVADERAAVRRKLAAQLADAANELGDLRTVDAFVGVAMQALSKVPVVGQVAAGIYDLIKMFVVADAQGKAGGRSVWRIYGQDLSTPNILQAEGPLVTGWRGAQAGGNYYLQGIPILSFTAPIYANQLITYAAAYAAPMRALILLCAYFPWGAPVASIDVSDTGQLVYTFNRSGNNDTSQAAIDRKEVYTTPVWSPADISPTGPRGFDPANPREWFGRAQAEAIAKGWIETTVVRTGDGAAGGL